MRTTGILAILLLLSAPGLSLADTYHIDALNGSDATGDGSGANPYQTIDAVWPQLTGGDTVVLYDGNYGAIEKVTSGGPYDLFADWVTFRAAPGASPEIEHIRFGANGGSYYGADQSGTFDVYLRFEGLHIKDGLLSYGARHWALVGCLVERYGPWTGSVENIEKTAVSWRGGTDILIDDCEITNTGTAIAGRGHDIRIIGNHIHGGTHDGIRVAGFRDSLIEGNLIHDFDDGVTDGEASWSRHCDLIHIFIPGPGNEGRQNHNVIFRNNVLYDAESQIVQFNNYGGNRNEIIIFENNIFGPGRAVMFNNADPCDTLIFRHNTVLYFPEGRQFNRWLCGNYTLRISKASTGVEIYNNILGSIGIETGAEVLEFDWNLVQIPGNPIGVDDSRAFGRFTLIGNDPLFVNPEDLDGRLQPYSPAVNAATLAFAPDPLYPWDYEGTPRDNRPDMGMWELPDQNPLPEYPPPSFPGPKTVFVDDFEDGHYKDVDPWLEGPGRQGLSWYRPNLPDKYYVTNSSNLDRNSLMEPTGRSGEQRVCWLFSEQGGEWIDYDFEFDAFNSYLVTGGGPAVLALDEQNAYWLDISRDNGRLVRLMTDAGGRPTVVELARSSDIELPHYGPQHYKVSVRHTPGGITISVDVAADGSVEFSYTDDDPEAIAKFASGGIAFHGDVNDQYHKITYDNIEVTVLASTSDDPPEIVKWELLENHGTAGQVAIIALDGHIVSTSGGVRGLRVTFSKPVDPNTVDNSVVAIQGQLSGDLSHVVDGVSLGLNNTRMTISLSAPLPDGDRFVLTVAGSVVDPLGRGLSGGRDRILSVLTGDVNGSGMVTFADVLAVRSRIGQSLAAGNASYDVNDSGVITAGDMLAVRALQGHSLP